MANGTTSTSYPKRPQLQKICTRLHQELFYNSNLHPGLVWRLGGDGLATMGG